MGKLINLHEANEHFKSGIESVTGLNPGSSSIIFVCKDNTIIEMSHEQECCESVIVEGADSYDNKDDIYTDCEWCEMSKEVNHDAISDNLCFNAFDSFTWTFYKVKTNRGYDTIRWYGESNGYYSEEVDFFYLGQFNEKGERKEKYLMINLYTTHCPLCRGVEMLLKKKQIEYNEITDVDIMKEKNINHVPVLEVDGQLYTGKEIHNWINNQK